MTMPLQGYQLVRNAWMTALLREGDRQCWRSYCQYVENPRLLCVMEMPQEQRQAKEYRVCALALLAEVAGLDPIKVFFEEPMADWQLAKLINVPAYVMQQVVSVSDGFGATFREIHDIMLRAFAVIDRGSVVNLCDIYNCRGDRVQPVQKG